MNKKSTTIWQRARQDALKIFLYSIPVSVILIIIEYYFGELILHLTSNINYPIFLSPLLKF